MTSGCGFKTSLEPGDISPSHRKFLNAQLPYFVDSGRCFVHGGFDRTLPLEAQRAEEFYWNRDLWQQAWEQSGGGKMPTAEGFFASTDFSRIYLGHTPTTKLGTDKPLQAFQIYNLDTGAGHSGRLTIMNVDTGEYWQSDPVLSLYAENTRLATSPDPAETGT